MELYRKYRPKSFSEVVGQPEVVGIMKGWVRTNSVPHAIMLEGPSGCGKTTLARILANELGAVGMLNYSEINVAEERGVGMVADLGEDVNHNITGKNRVWVLDEVQGLLKPAQQSLLKKLEEAPEYAYFILCTTNTEKLLPTVLNRCSRLSLRLLDATAIKKMLSSVLDKENRNDVPDRVIEAIAVHCGGSGRQAMVKLEQCLTTSNPDNMMRAVSESAEGYEATIHDLCAILTNNKSEWKAIASILLNLKEEPETIRRSLLNWFMSALLKGWARSVTNDALAQSIKILELATYDSGKAGLVREVYEVYKATRQ